MVRKPDLLLMDSSLSRNLSMNVLDARPGLRRGPYVRENLRTAQSPKSDFAGGVARVLGGLRVIDSG
jgi:hypothetical protein